MASQTTEERLDGLERRVSQLESVLRPEGPCFTHADLQAWIVDGSDAPVAKAASGTAITMKGTEPIKRYTLLDALMALVDDPVKG